MKITEQSDTRLILTADSWKAAALLAAMACVIFVITFTQNREAWAAALGPAFLALLAWFTRYRSITIFDKPSRRLHHELRRIGRSRQIAGSFDDVQQVSVARLPASRRSQSWLVQVHMKDGQGFWLSPQASRSRSSTEAFAALVRQYLGLNLPRD